jgi:membrane fusion protein (multidrug efflux system)
MPKRGVPELCLVIALLAGCKRPETPPAARLPVVEVARVEQRDVPVYREWIATLDGYVNAQIQPRVSGYVIAQRFQEGSFVRKNELLFEIDARPFRAALDQANAQLAERRADAARAARDVERDRPLAEARAIPRSQLDNDIQIHNAAVAAVDAARATAHQAELDVGFTRVGSLIDGIVGIAEVQVGNLVSPTSVLTTVSQVDPIRAWFAISEQEYLDVADLLHGASVPSGAGAGVGTGARELEFELTLTDGSKYPHAGRFLFANRQVDSLTGTLRIATEFANPRRLLRPGQFGRVRAATRIEHNALLVPQRAVTELQGTFQVMVLKSDSTVTVQPVVLGPQVDSLRVIERGLRPDQLVIVEGTQQVRPGIKVAAKPYGPARGPARGTGY